MLSKGLKEDRNLSYLGERTLLEERTASAKVLWQDYSPLVGGRGGRQAWLGRSEQEREAL